MKIEALISIHAPAWGATETTQFSAQQSAISIHAPAWGATVRRGRRVHLRTYFNPRARVGRDQSSQTSSAA